MASYLEDMLRTPRDFSKDDRLIVLVDLLQAFLRNNPELVVLLLRAFWLYGVPELNRPKEDLDARTEDCDTTPPAAVDRPGC